MASPMVVFVPYRDTYRGIGGILITLHSPMTLHYFFSPNCCVPFHFDHWFLDDDLVVFFYFSCLIGDCYENVHKMNNGYEG